MQPTFPPDHHFHRRAQAPRAHVTPRISADEAAYHARHRVPLLDPGDPRDAR
jgi:hypothetical protein